MGTYHYSGLQRSHMLQELFHPHWSNTTRCISPCSAIPCTSSLITHWAHPIDYHHLLFQCSDTISIQGFTVVTCFQCFFIHPRSNVLSSFSLSTLQRGGSATSLSTPTKIDSAACHFLLFTAVTSSSASLSNTPVVNHHPVFPSCDTNWFIIQTGKIYPVAYQSKCFSAVMWFKCLFIHSLEIHTL